MKNLFQIEYIKIARYGTARVLLGMHLLIFLIILVTFSQVDFAIPGFNMNRLYRIPALWISTTWLASWLNLLLGILIIILAGNEFSYRTFRQNIITGLSRQQLLYSKYLVIFTFAVYGFILVLLSTMAFGLFSSIKYGLTDFFANIHYVFVYFLQALAYMSFALLICLIFKNTALSIVMFLLYRIVIEPILRTAVEVDFKSFFPMKAITGLTPNIVDLIESAGAQVQDLDLQDADIFLHKVPLAQNTGIVLFYVALFFGLSYWIIKKRNF